MTPRQKTVLRVLCWTLYIFGCVVGYTDDAAGAKIIASAIFMYLTTLT